MKKIKMIFITNIESMEAAVHWRHYETSWADVVITEPRGVENGVSARELKGWGYVGIYRTSDRVKLNPPIPRPYSMIEKIDYQKDFIPIKFSEKINKNSFPIKKEKAIEDGLLGQLEEFKVALKNLHLSSGYVIPSVLNLMVGTGMCDEETARNNVESITVDGEPIKTVNQLVIVGTIRFRGQVRHIAG